MNSDTRKVLLGALIGIGRAAETSAHLIDRSLDLYILQALASCDDPSVTDEQALEFAQALNEEKAILVPDCAMCCEPCGRTDDYDFASMADETDSIIRLKENIISLAIKKATELLEPAQDGESLLLFPFYRALFAIGARDWDENDLQSVIDELGSM